MAFWVYVLACADGSHLVGHTEDLDRQMGNLALGRGNKYTARRRPVSLRHVEEIETRRDATARVRRIRGYLARTGATSA
jgi:predicted GIY-YIG superfamily endonuclease